MSSSTRLGRNEDETEHAPAHTTTTAVQNGLSGEIEADVETEVAQLTIGTVEMTMRFERSHWLQEN